MSAATKSLSNIDCSAEESHAPTPILYCPRVPSTDYSCDASRAVAQQQLRLPPPDWLRELNQCAKEYGFGPDIDRMTMKEAEEYLAYVKREEEQCATMLQCIVNAMTALMPLKLEKEKFMATFTSIVNHCGREAYWTEHEPVSEGGHEVQELTMAVSVELLGLFPGECICGCRGTGIAVVMVGTRRARLDVLAVPFTGYGAGANSVPLEALVPHSVPAHSVGQLALAAGSPYRPTRVGRTESTERVHPGKSSPRPPSARTVGTLMRKATPLRHQNGPEAAFEAMGKPDYPSDAGWVVGLPGSLS